MQVEMFLPMKSEKEFTMYYFMCLCESKSYLQFHSFLTKKMQWELYVYKNAICVLALRYHIHQSARMYYIDDVYLFALYVWSWS